jgi:ABC-type nickel/cobalt efflux system permease component RcnA
LVALALAYSGSAHAQNRFRTPGEQTAPALPSGPAQQQQPSIFTQLVQGALAFQRDMVRDIGRYMAAIRDGTGSSAVWIGVGFAFVYGVLHTLGPGHGKTIVASYFVGSDARVLRGLSMGLQIAVTHVVSAVVLVTIFDISYRQLLGGDPIQSVWIGLVSYGIVTIIGATMLVRAIRQTFFAHAGHGHGHDHDHHHHHSHDWREEGALAVLAGLVPCTGAILVMLFALANGIVVAGVLMVVAISLGMAVTMAAIGMASILFRRLVLFGATEGSNRHAVAGAVLEHAAAVLILAIGLAFLTTTVIERFA